MPKNGYLFWVCTVQMHKGVDKIRELAAKNQSTKGPLFGNRKPAWVGGMCAPNEVRTRVSALRGLRPGPLDNGGGERRNFTISHRLRQL